MGIPHRKLILTELVQADGAKSWHIGKVKMKLCDYQILEYTSTELRTHGVQFVVVLRLHAIDSYALNGYVLRDWRKKIEAASKSDFEDVEIFLKDLRHHCRNQDSVTSVFDGLDRLSFGPIRPLVSGSCSFKDLDEVVQVFFNGETCGSSSWLEHFDALHDDDSI
jgi:hypothetical protein